MNLIPNKPCNAPNYWCTWAIQNYMYGQRKGEFEFKELEGDRGAYHARSNLNEDLMLGVEGWAKNLYHEVRGDLFIILDDGWDVPVETPPSSTLYYSSFHLNTVKFPSFAGIPQERLKAINEEIKRLGWRGIGLWVACQEATEYLSESDNSHEKYWRERVDWSKYAGISYWKVDWGKKAYRKNFRRFLTNLGKEFYPNLIIEHATLSLPFNSPQGNGRVDNTYINKCAKFLEFSSVLRLYDVSSQLSIPTMLDRVANVLKVAKPETPGLHLINCEDEVYIAAALGCVTGILRHPLKGLRPNGDIVLSFIGPRHLKKRIDEVIRAIHWHRIAPPFNAGSVAVEVDRKILHDKWEFKEGETWFSNVIGKTVIQGAPARIARGLELPQVDINDDPPFVITSRNPNGAISIATLGRVSPERGFYVPKANVTIEVGEHRGIFGIFGSFNNLVIQFEEKLGFKTIFAQDLAGKTATDITNKIIIKAHDLEISGEMIEKLGLFASNVDDISDPRLVMCLR